MMDFRIADTFLDSLNRLSDQEQKAAKTAAFDLQLNPSHPGLQYHKLDRAKDPNFSSVRVSRDVRIIVHRTGSSFMVCYVGHHDDAYQWAQRRKLEVHPTTGAAQLVEIRERVEEIVIPQYVAEVRPKPALFADTPEAELLGYGVPPEWLEDVRKANEDNLLGLADHLPGEAAEALLELATGGKPKIAVSQPATVDPFEHPDAQRRFRVMKDVDELTLALEAPWEKWTVFLHPDQRETVEYAYNGPARVSGSAGTGKTIVALHRAVYLARQNPDSRVVLTTFSEALANALRSKLRRLIINQPRLSERLDVYAMSAFGQRLYEKNIGKPKIASPEMIRELIQTASQQVPGHSFSQNFLAAEWEQVVDAWQLRQWEEYRDVLRLGRKTRLPERQRQQLWEIFKLVRASLADGGMITDAELFTKLAEHYAEEMGTPYDFIVIDESQDVSVPQLRLLAALGKDQPNSLFFAGDLGQRIFQQPFSWKALGVDIRGRSRTLRVNYRTTHQIRMQADKLLGQEIADVDGNVEERRGTVSVFNGPLPEIKLLGTPEEEIQAVSEWLKLQIAEGMKPEELGVFVRSAGEIERGRTAIDDAGLVCSVLDEKIETVVGEVSLSTMHLAKGLEFRAVAVMACDDGVIPLEERIEQVTDQSDLDEVFNSERHLLYVACTRARDRLLVTGIEPGSEFLDDLVM